MHRALRTPEITTLVLRYVKQMDTRPFPLGPAQVTLAAVARTCRILSDIALDLLWEEQEGLLNLIRCRPEDAWGFVPVPRGEDEYFDEMDDDDPRARLILRRPICAADWSRTGFYAPRLKYIKLTTYVETNDTSPISTTIVIPSKTLTDLAISCPRTPLFSSLVSISVDRGLETHIDFLPTLIGPSLRYLTLDEYPSSPSSSHLVVIVYAAQQALNLESLFLTQTIEGAGIVLLQETIRRFHNLRHLRFPLPLSIDICSIFVWLTSFSHLTSIVLDEVRTPIIRPDVMMNLMTSQRLTGIEALSFHQIDSISALSVVLPIVSSWPLENISLDFRCGCPNEVQELLVEIASHINHETLRSLHVYFDSNMFHAFAGPTLTLTTFAPLTAFHKLQILYFDACAILALDDRSLGYMTTAWPMLQKLCLLSTVQC